MKDGPKSPLNDFIINSFGGFMKKAGSIIKTEKQFSPGITVIILAICFILMGCSDVTGPSSASEISSDLRNTTWIKQNTALETITISFGQNTLIMSGDGVSSQYTQQWDYFGGSCCGYGFCSFYNGQTSLEFRYRRSSSGLNITGSNVQSLNGSWTRN